MVGLETKQDDKLSSNLAQSCQISNNSNECNKQSITTTDEANNKKSKKKKKNSSVATTTTTLNPSYTSSLANYPIKATISKAKGRHAIAAENLAEGTTVCQEQATAFVVRSDYLQQQCHVCLKDGPIMKCADCSKTFYCSQECLQQDEEVHCLVCDAFKQVDAIGSATNVDPDLLKMIALLMARRYLDNKDDDEQKGVGLNNKPTPYWCVEDLVSHREHVSEDFTSVVKEASSRLLFELPQSIQMSAEDMVTLACRINSNAHGLGDNQSRNTDVALGLFPLGALFFNHGCNPNTAFVGLTNGQLAFRTIRPVKKDEELVVSYIDLYSDRDERRQDLLSSKHFWCKCKRCTNPIEKSVDRFLQGVVCYNCKNDVYVIPPSLLEELKKGQRNLYANNGTFKCATCQHEVECKKIRGDVEKVSESYMLGMNAIRREHNYRRGAEKLEKVTKSKTECGGALHALNSFRLNSYIPLMNCKRREGDLKSAIDINKAILNMMEQYTDTGMLPANTSEISDYWLNLGELCSKMASETYGRSGSSVLEKKWQKEAKKAFAEAHKIRTVVFGKDHSKTKSIEEFIV